MSHAEEEVERLLAELRHFVAAAPFRISPHAVAMDFFCKRLSGDRRRLMSLACASRVAPFVDAAIAAIPRLASGDAAAFTSAVDQAFELLRTKGSIDAISLLQKYLELLNEGAISEAQGGQGESLVEEVLTPAMRILAAVISEDGMTVKHRDEDDRELCARSYDSANEVCRIANALVDPGKFPDSDEGGIPPWVLESVELDSQWRTIEILLPDVEIGKRIESVRVFSVKCRKQNMRLTKHSAEKWQKELSTQGRNV